MAPISYEAVTPDGVPSWLLRLDLRGATLRVLDARDHGAPALTAQQFREKTGAQAVWNASFFDGKGDPLGLIVKDGIQVQGVRPVDWGVFYLDAVGPHVVHRQVFAPGPGLLQAVESGPRLVVGGEPVRLRPQAARRTALCVHKDGGILVLVADGDLAATPMAEFLRVRGCVDALNLDGGPSSQLSVAGPEHTLEVAGGLPVPIAMGAFAQSPPLRIEEPGCGCGVH